MIAKIAQLANEKVIAEVADIRDESSHRVGMRIVIVLKRDAVPTVVLNKLFKHTPLQSTFGVYMLALVDNVPRVLGLREILTYYIAHQKDVVTRRTKYLLEQAEKRAHVLEGFLVALDNLDAVIQLIRTSSDTNTARTGLMETFDLSEIQAQAILDLRLQRLTSMGQGEIRAEHAKLVAEIARLRGILGDERKVYELIRTELLEVRAKHADVRRTQIVPDEGEIDHEATIPDEDMVISLTSTGYVKRVPLDEYRQQRRGGRGRMGMRTKEDDWIAHLFVASAHDWVLFFTSRGRFYRVKAWELPLANLQARGRPIVNFLPLEEGERVMSVFRTRDFTEGRYLVMGTRQGVVKKTAFSAYASRAARNAIAIRDDDELVDVRLADDDDQILLVSRNRMAARFPASEIRSTGRDTMGVRGMRLDPDDAVIAIRVPREDADILVITADGVGKRTPFAEYRLTHRGARGVLTMARDGKGGTLVGALSVAEGDHVMLITEGGIITRMAVDEIRVIGRTTQGVIIQRVPEGDQIAAVALVPEADEAEADAADAAVTSLDEALAEPADSEGGPFDAPGVVPPEDVAVVAGVGEPPDEVEAATDESEAGSAPEPEPDEE